MAQYHQRGEQSLPDRLLRCLEDLTLKDLKRFKWHMCHQLKDCWKPIPCGRVEELDEMEMVDTLVQAYNLEGALEVTLYILRKMDFNELALWLQRDPLPSTPDMEHHATVDQTDQRTDDVNYSSDSEDSVYWDAQENYQSLSVKLDEGVAASATSLSVVHEGVAASRASFFGEHGEVQATSTMPPSAGLLKGPAIFKQNESGHSASKLTGDPEEQGATSVTSVTANHEEQHDCSITRFPRDPEQRVVNSDTSPPGEHENGGNASLSKFTEDLKEQLDATDTSTSGEDVDGITGKLEEGHSNSEQNPVDGAASCHRERVSTVTEPKNLLGDITMDLTFKMLFKTLQQLLEDELERFKRRLIKDHPELFDRNLEDKHALDVVKMLLNGTDRSESVNITLQVLRSINQEALANSLESEKDNAIRKFQEQLFFKVKRELQRIF